MPSEAGDEQAPEPPKSTDNLGQASSSEKPKGDNDYGKENLDHRPSTTNIAGDKEKEKDKRKPTKPVQEPFEACEREEMEKLLGELRGHLGELAWGKKCDGPIDAHCSHIPNTILGRGGYREQLPLQRRPTSSVTDLQLIHSLGQSLAHFLNPIFGCPLAPVIIFPHDFIVLFSHTSWRGRGLGVYYSG